MRFQGGGIDMMSLHEASILINTYRANYPEKAHDIEFFMSMVLKKVKSPDNRRTLLHLFCEAII
jgi:hypothetical protein